MFDRKRTKNCIPACIIGMKIAKNMKLTNTNLFILIILAGVCQGNEGCSGDQNITISHYHPDGQLANYTCASITADWPYYCIANDAIAKWQPSGGQAGYPYQICCASCAAITPSVLSCTNRPLLFRAGNQNVTCKQLVQLVDCDYSEMLHTYCCASCPTAFSPKTQNLPAGKNPPPAAPLAEQNSPAEPSPGQNQPSPAGDNQDQSKLTPITAGPLISSSPAQPQPTVTPEAPNPNFSSSPMDRAVLTTPAKAKTCSNTITPLSPFKDDQGNNYTSCKLLLSVPSNLAYCSRTKIKKTLCCRSCKCIDPTCKDDVTYQFPLNDKMTTCDTLFTLSSTRQKIVCAMPGVPQGCCATCAVAGGILSKCNTAGNK